MLVSVLMSVYNSEQFLDKAIQSILNQTYSEFEFIIIDDGSNDRSAEICLKYGSTDRRIIFVQNERNLGLAESLNKGLEMAKGEYIARQDADDISTADRLELQVNYALNNKHVDLIGSDCYTIDISDHIVFQDDSYSKNKDFWNTLLSRKAIFPHGSALIKKSKLFVAGLYNPRFYYVQDGELWLRLIHQGAIVHVINKPLYFYRVGPVSSEKRRHLKTLFNKVLQMKYVKQDKEDLINRELDRIDALRKSLNPPNSPYYMADYWRSLGNAAYFNKWDVKNSMKYVIKALKEPNSFLQYPNYFLLSLIYMLPPVFIKSLMSFRRTGL